MVSAWWDEEMHVAELDERLVRVACGYFGSFRSSNHQDLRVYVPACVERAVAHCGRSHVIPSGRAYQPPGLTSGDLVDAIVRVLGVGVDAEWRQDQYRSVRDLREDDIAAVLLLAVDHR